MNSSASIFIASRKNAAAISNNRVTQILWYVTECYGILQKTTPVYSKSWCKTKTKLKFEDYLKINFVQEYLIRNKEILQSKVSELEQVIFNYETNKIYSNIDGIPALDKIDIYITKIGLQDHWKVPDDDIYLAIECKRIASNSNCTDYVGDILKFCGRSYHQLRLPIECMIAFIENSSLTHESISEVVSDRLLKKSELTVKRLKSCVVNPAFQGSYLSEHKKSISPFELFYVYHLLFDYSSYVVE